MTVPYTFATQTSSIPLSELDANFATAITLGGTNIYLGNTTTTITGLTLTGSTFTGNVTSSNVTVTGGTIDATVIGGTTPAAGAFSLLNASGTVSGAGFSTYLASPPAIGGTAAAAGTFTTLTATTSNQTNETVSGSFTLSGGTANGVAYLNGSKALTTGSALTFDGTNLTSGTFIPSSSTAPTNGMYLPSSNTLAWSTNSSRGMTLDSSGNLAIAAQSLFAQGNGYNGNTGSASNGTLCLWDANGFTALKNNWGSGAITFSVGGSEQMRLNTTGLGIGTSSPNDKLQLNSSGQAGLSITANSYQSYFAGVASSGNYANGTLAGDTIVRSASRVVFSSNSGTNLAAVLDNNGNLGLGVTPSAWSSATAFQIGAKSALYYAGSNTNLGDNIYFAGTSKYITSAAASVYAQSSGSHQWYNAPSGTAGSAATLTQAMTLDNNGNLMLGTTSALSGAARVALSATSGQTDAIHTQPTSNVTYYPAVFYNSSGSTVGYIQATNTATVYSVSSDIRLKENVIDSPQFGDLIDSLQVRSFDWKADGSHQRAGFIAQELLVIVPEAVSQRANPDDMMGVDYSKLVPMLVKEIQSLRARLKAANIA